MPYDFHPDLRRYAHFHMPVLPWLAPVMQKMMGALYRLEKSDACVRVTHRQIPTCGGGIRALLYEPVNAAADSPCLLFLHGGGFVYNAAPHHFVLARRLARELGWRVLAPDYRLAPGHRFPAAQDDCMDAYRWLLDSAESLGVDKTRIAVGGDSAGGCLAAVLCIEARDQDIQPPAAQLLIYPAADRRTETESCRRFTDTPMCRREDMKRYMSMYLPDDALADRRLVTPMEADDLSGLPPAYVETAEYDCLHDEGVLFARALARAGTKSELHETKKAMHGYDIAAGSGFLDKIMAERVAFLRKNV